MAGALAWVGVSLVVMYIHTAKTVKPGGEANRAESEELLWSKITTTENEFGVPAPGKQDLTNI
jgi:hypothetical protein